MSLPAINDLTSEELISLASVIRERIKDIAIENIMNDEQAQELVMEKISSSKSNNPTVIDAEMGIVGLSSLIEYNSTYHNSHHYTVQSEAGEYWQWDNASPTYIHTQTARVGKIRKTTSLHQFSTGDKIWYHVIRYSDTGEIKNRTMVKCWLVNEKLQLELIGNPTPRPLPIPTESKLEKELL